MFKERVYLALSVLLGGLIGKVLGIPLGILLGSASGVLLLQRFWRKVTPLNPYVKKGIQSIVGGITGLNLTADFMQTFMGLWKTIIIYSVIHLLLLAAVVFILHRFFKWDLLTAACSAAPAGLMEIVLITDGLNLPMATVISTHLYRVVLIITVVPALLTILT